MESAAARPNTLPLSKSIYCMWRWVESADKTNVLLKNYNRFLKSENCRAEGMRCAPPTCVEVSLQIHYFDRDDNCVRIVECMEEQQQQLPLEEMVELAETSTTVDLTESRLMVGDENLMKTNPNSTVNSRTRVVFTKSLTDKQQSCKSNGQLRVTAVYFKGEPLVDISRWVQPPEGGWKITKKGITMPLVRWVQLLARENYINNLLQDIKSGAMVDEKLHLGGPLMLKLCSPFWTLHLRQYYKDKKSGTIMPTRRGIVLNHLEWDVLLQQVTRIQEKMPEIAGTHPCFFDHDQEKGRMICAECSPWTYEEYSA